MDGDIFIVVVVVKGKGTLDEATTRRASTQQKILVPPLSLPLRLVTALLANYS